MAPAPDQVIVPSQALGAPRVVRRAMASLEGRGMADLSAMPPEVRAVVPKRVREAMAIVEAYVAELEKGG